MEVSTIRLVYFYRKFLLKWQYELDVALTLPDYSLYSGSLPSSELARLKLWISFEGEK